MGLAAISESSSFVKLKKCGPGYHTLVSHAALDGAKLQLWTSGINTDLLANPRAVFARFKSVLREYAALTAFAVTTVGELYRHLKSFAAYYHESRTHLSLAKDAPEPRSVQKPERGRIVAIPQVGGLHYRYERRAA